MPREAPLRGCVCQDPWRLVFRPEEGSLGTRALLLAGQQPSASGTEQGSPRTLDFGKLGASRSLVPRSGGQRQVWGPLSRASGILLSHLLNIQVTLDPQTSLLLAFCEDCSEHSGNISSTPGMLTGSSPNTAISGAAPASPDALLASPGCPCSLIANKPPHGTQAPRRPHWRPARVTVASKALTGGPALPSACLLHPALRLFGSLSRSPGLAASSSSDAEGRRPGSAGHRQGAGQHL